MEKNFKVSPDDVTDIFELSLKIKKEITKILSKLPNELATSALMTASINCAILFSKDLDHFISYRDVIINILDDYIITLKNKK